MEIIIKKSELKNGLMLFYTGNERFLIKYVLRTHVDEMFKIIAL